MNRDVLVSAGIDYDQGVNRFAGKAQIYEKFLKRLFEEESMSQLGTQLAEKDYESAFKTAHNLKGMSGNLSLNQFYKAICEIVEELRNGQPGDDILTSYQHASVLYEKAKRTIQEDAAKDESKSE